MKENSRFLGCSIRECVLHFYERRSAFGGSFCWRDRIKVSRYTGVALHVMSVSVLREDILVGVDGSCIGQPTCRQNSFQSRQEQGAVTYICRSRDVDGP